jgi:hypothetical protein
MSRITIHHAASPSYPSRPRSPARAAYQGALKTVYAMTEPTSADLETVPNHAGERGEPSGQPPLPAGTSLHSNHTLGPFQRSLNPPPRVLHERHVLVRVGGDVVRLCPCSASSGANAARTYARASGASRGTGIG